MERRQFVAFTTICFVFFWNIASLQNTTVIIVNSNDTQANVVAKNVSLIALPTNGNVTDEKPSNSSQNVTDVLGNRQLAAVNLSLPSTTAPTNSLDVKPVDLNGTSILPDISNTSKINVSSTTQSVDPVLPDKEAAEDEHNSSMAIFFVLCVLVLGILLIHLMLQTGFQYVPESIVIVFLGALIGFTMSALSNRNISNWRKEEAFSPTAFFLILLPPIIFESGYNLHKGNFFQNIGSILVFAIVGTTISAFVIGFGIYFLGLAEVVYRLSFVESFAFGSLISAVDPVATVAIFHALNVDPVLNMLVFGESILNDAIAIVLTTAVLESNNPLMSTGEAIVIGIQNFCLMFFASAGIGVIFALISALLLKHVDLRKNPSLEFGMMLVFTYAPYVLAEGIHLSGIMAILFCGIVMSHYTHFNLSTVTQITMQQTLRTLAFIAETCVFAYLGLALFSFKHRVEPALIVWSIILCLIGRACNIFPLAILVNRFREHQITRKMMFIMWFSGLRGAISYALSLHLNFSDETRHVIITTTLIIVLFTTLFFGGSTMPLLKFMQATKNPARRLKKRKKDREVTLSKTREWGQALDSEHLSETTEGEMEVSFVSDRIKGFAKYDLKYFIPFFTRRFTQQTYTEININRPLFHIQMHTLVINYPANAKNMAISNCATCGYMLLIVLWYYLSNSLYDIGHLQNTYFQWLLAGAELAKYLLFAHYAIKEVKRAESRKLKTQNIIKATFTMLGAVAGFHAIAVLFGAPFFSKQQETLTFALTMGTLTVLPCILHLGADQTISLFLSLISPKQNEVEKKFLIVVQLTCFGAWLAAVVIPLDWNRAFQVWPTPCILGAVAGNFLGNLLLVLLHSWQKKARKNLKTEC